MSDFEYVGGELFLFREAANWKRYWSRVITPFLGSRVLDVGAGIGATAQTLAKRDYTRWVELEPDPAQAREIERLRESGEIPAYYELRIGTSDDLAEDDCFDTVLYIDVLEHIEDDRGELARAVRHLVPGGNVVVVAPAHNSLYTPFDRSVGHFRRYDRKSLTALVPAGCDIVFSRYLDSAGLLASTANRLLLRKATPSLGQILFWDRVLVRCSLLLDRVTFGFLGKTIVCIYRKRA